MSGQARRATRPGPTHGPPLDEGNWSRSAGSGRTAPCAGVVLLRDRFLRLPGASNEERLEQALAGTPGMARLMRDAIREWPVRVEKDFSYRVSSYAGARWILAGDAGSFLDPVFSTGVSIAMESGIEAAAEFDRALERGDFSARAFAAFSRRQRRRYDSYRRFVVGFYTPEFRDLFFDPSPPRPIVRAVVTVLAGRWDASWRARAMNGLFFLLVAVQRHFPLVRSRIRQA